MPTLAAGSKPQRGWTLVELLVVLAILAMVTGVATLSLPNAEQRLLQQEATRLLARVDAARAQSRALGVPVWLEVTAQGWAIEGAPAPAAYRHAWTDPGLRLRIESPLNAQRIWLGPDPVMAPTVLRLNLAQAQLRLGSQGVAAWAVLP